jgi:hypothetical protein
MGRAVSPLPNTPSWRGAWLVGAQGQLYHLLWKPKVRHLPYKIPPLDPVLRQRNPVHILPPYFSKMQSYICLTSRSRSWKWSLPIKFHHHHHHHPSRYRPFTACSGSELLNLWICLDIP